MLVSLFLILCSDKRNQSKIANIQKSSIEARPDPRLLLPDRKFSLN